jgi:charged multivesicular body protein 2A
MVTFHLSALFLISNFIKGIKFGINSIKKLKKQAQKMGIIKKIFGKPKTPKELMREYKRGIERSIRELDREREKIQVQEKKQIVEMKALAKKNQIEAVKIMARNLVQTRRYITKFHKMKAQLNGISLQITTMSSTAEMTKAMKNAGRCMTLMNKQMDLPAMQKIIKDFSQQSEIMDMKEEMVGDAIDGAMEGDDDEAEEENLVNQVLDEIGLTQTLDLPSSKLTQKVKETGIEEDALQVRLQNLKNQ